MKLSITVIQERSLMTHEQEYRRCIKYSKVIIKCELNNNKAHVATNNDDDDDATDAPSYKNSLK